MKKILKKLLSGTVFAVFLGLMLGGLLPGNAHAAAGVGFGAQVAVLVDYGDICDCSLATYIWFYPLFINSDVPLSGPLTTYPEVPLLYPDYDIVEGQAVLGTELPGTQACYIIVGDACSVLPTLGFIEPMTASGGI